jgi:TolA-binding protein
MPPLPSNTAWLNKASLKAAQQSKFESELSLLKENSQYYEALCALELGNDDAESMFLRFIKEHPENPLTKLAYFQVGKSYFKQGKYEEALVWFNKVQAVELNGAQNTEYKFRKGYAYFRMLNDYKNAQSLFGEVKKNDRRLLMMPLITLLTSLI